MNLIALFASRGLTIGLIAGALVVVATWDRSRIWRAEERGKEQVRVDIERKSNANARKAETARRSADGLPPDRLRDSFCRDCR